MESTHWWQPHTHEYSIMPLAFMLAICVLAGFIDRRVGTWRCRVGRSVPGPHGWRDRGPMAQEWPETPGQILDRRYASGDITREQYEQLKRDLDVVDTRPASGAA